MVYGSRNCLTFILANAEDVFYAKEVSGWRDTKPDSVVDVIISKEVPEEIRAQMKAELALYPFIYVREDGDVPVRVRVPAPVPRPVMVSKIWFMAAAMGLICGLFGYFGIVTIV